MIIIGAGIAGLSARSFFGNDSIVIEKKSFGQPNNHKAILRIRDSRIGYLLGCKLEPIDVFRYIYDDNKVISSYDPILSNLYSLKVTGSISKRSIDNLGWCSRFLISSPINFNNVLFSKNMIKITPEAIYFEDGSSMPHDDIVSTIPLPTMLNLCGIENSIDFSIHSKTIFVTRAKLNIDSDICITAYIPNHSIGIYRVTIERNDLIIESMTDFDGSLDFVCRSVGILPSNVDSSSISTYRQENGKLSAIDDESRKYFIMKLTDEFRIYSFGRYATWRNLTSSDIIPDLEKISSIINVGKHEYNYRKKLQEV